ncbi:MAG: hypothetical protein R3208_10060 [Ketobacteraceae bacterium]|nr:hypothetical protein [Ketobacteraceae bacterium]
MPMMSASMQRPRIRHLTGTLFALIVFALLSLQATPVFAASWQVSEQEGVPVAVTPKHNMMLKMIKPKNDIWGKLYISLSDEQVASLRQHRIDKYFSFISVGVEVDRYTRNMNAKVEESKNFVRVDIDQRMWQGIKNGSRLNVYLPDGTTYKETLRGSSRALQKLEKHIFSQY